MFRQWKFTRAVTATAITGGLAAAGCGLPAGRASPAGPASTYIAPPPMVSSSPATTTSPTGDAGSAVRGTATVSLSTDDGYRGRVTLTAYEPRSLGDVPDGSALTECIGYPDPRSTAVVQADFTFADDSPAEFPWKLSWSVADLGTGGDILGTRTNLGEAFRCNDLATWSGNGTMSVLVAFYGYYSPKRPKGSPGMLDNAGVSYPLVGFGPNDKATVTAVKGKVQAGAEVIYGASLQFAFVSKK